MLLTFTKKAIRVVTLVTFMFLASACTAPIVKPSFPVPTDWVQRLENRVDMNTWEMSGRIAMHTGEESISASITWEQDLDRYAVKIAGPLGVGAMQLYGDDAGAVMMTSDGQVFMSHSVDEMLATKIGWNLPLQSLRYWILGIPHPTAQSQLQFDNQGQLLAITQEAWQINFSRYTNIENMDLPTKIAFMHPRVRMRLVIDGWSFPNTNELKGSISSEVP